MLSSPEPGPGDQDVGLPPFALFEEAPLSIGGPMAVNRLLNQLFTVCWFMLPKDQKSVESLEKEIRRIVDRAIKDLREDCQSFKVDEREEEH